jgi:hypothetical protein
MNNLQNDGENRDGNLLSSLPWSTWTRFHLIPFQKKKTELKWLQLKVSRKKVDWTINGLAPNGSQENR